MSALRSQPNRIFMPLAALLGAVGVAPWLLYTIGWVPTYSAQGHALAQVQGFLTSAACGFLFTMLPRRTRTAPPTALEILVLATLLSLAAGCSLFELWLVSQLAYAAALVVVLRHVIPRTLGRPPRRPPDAFVLLPLGFGAGLAGTLLLLARELGLGGIDAVAIGRALVQEGTFLCLTLGVGAFVLPLLSGRELPPDAAPESARQRLAWAGTGGLILATLVVPPLLDDGAVAGPALTRWSLVLRMLAVAVPLLLLGAASPPRAPGTQRRLTWGAAWAVPAGLLAAALFPAHRAGALHVLFIGGFALMAMSVAAHVLIAHGARPERRDLPSWGLRLFGLLALLALLARVGAEMLPESYWEHLASASVTWMLAVVAWLATLGPHLRRRADPD